jgi:deazaflavin-dependent oxidoreductase (nitroreductase family)
MLAYRRSGDPTWATIAGVLSEDSDCAAAGGGLGGLAAHERGHSSFRPRSFGMLGGRMSEFQTPSAVEAFFNRAMGLLAALGMGPGFIYLLQVRGRKSGKIFSTPVNLMEFAGQQILVAPRGRTQWVRNAEAAGEITLKRGSRRLRYGLREIGDEGKPEILREYLRRYVRAVGKFFPVRADAPLETFRGIAGNYPVFELEPRT